VPGVFRTPGTCKSVEKYGAWVFKKMYGREYFGVERSTFLIDPEGKTISIDELVPVAKSYDTEHTPILGVMAGMFVMAVSLQLLK